MNTASNHYIYARWTDVTKPTIENLNAKGYIGGNTLTATIIDNDELSGIYFTTDKTYSCGSTNPETWTNVSGKTYNLNRTILTYGSTYIWVKDIAGNTNCYEKTLYKTSYNTSETTTCSASNCSLIDDGTKLVLTITATCNCESQGTCKNGIESGTDIYRASIFMYTYGSNTATYTFSDVTYGSFRNLIYYNSNDHSTHQNVNPNEIITAYSSGWLSYNVGYGRAGESITDTAYINKIVADSTIIYDNVFVTY